MSDATVSSKITFQEQALEGVSRTFALTIPQLPYPLKHIITNAYLLCRIADTIEDEPALESTQKKSFHDQFILVVAGKRDAQAFAESLFPLLSDSTSDAEKDLIRQLDSVIEFTHSFTDRQQAVLYRCVTIMCQGMPCFSLKTSRAGLASQAELDQYCYIVAGVVGELLTELFCDYDPEIRRYKDELLLMAVSFGQGLQMTNILKDIWEDRSRGSCWLPRDLFRKYGVDLAKLNPETSNPGFSQGMENLIGITHGHLRWALSYTLHIPSRDAGVRKFCLWAIGMALLTLRRIARNPEYKEGKEVKISRKAVKVVITAVNISVKNDYILTKLFDMAASGLPLVDVHVPELVLKGNSVDSLLESKLG